MPSTGISEITPTRTCCEHAKIDANDPHRGHPRPKMKSPRYRRRVQWHFATPFQHVETFASCSSAVILSPNILSGLTLDLHQAQNAQWDHLDVPNGGGEDEAFDRVIGPADNWVRGSKHRTGQCRSVLPIRCVSRRVRRKARRRTAAAAGRASRGDPRRRCPWCWSTSWNTDESWRSG
jgi:hypothetical protein